MPLLLSVLGCFGGSSSSDTEHPPLTPTVKPTAPSRPPLTTPGVLPLAPPAPGDPTPAIGSENCGDLEEGGKVQGPDCITSKIECGQTIAGHTKGGANAFDTKFYEKQFCTPALTNHDSGDERVYELVLPPGDRHAIAWLDTPCGDLDLAAIRVQEGATACPKADSTIKNCEMSVQPGNKREKVRIVSQAGTTWLLVVEGKGDAEGAFALTVQCGEGLQ